MILNIFKNLSAILRSPLCTNYNYCFSGYLYWQYKQALPDTIISSITVKKLPAVLLLWNHRGIATEK
jgi:hypothetical protein